MMRRWAFAQSGVGRKGLLAIGISLAALSLLVVAEGLVLKWLGFAVGKPRDRISVLQFCAPHGSGNALTVIWRRRGAATASLERYLQLHPWPLTQGEAFQWDQINPQSVAWTDRRGAVAIGSLEGTIYVWDTSKPQQLPQPLGTHPGCALLLAADGEGRWLATANDSMLRVWDLQAKQLQWQRDNLAANCIVVHPQSKNLVCGTGRGEVLELNITTGEIVRVVATHRAIVDCVAVSDDGTRVASIGGDKCLQITHWPSAETLWAQPHYSNSEVCFSPVGDILASSAFVDNRWKIITWNAETGRQQVSLDGHPSVVLGLKFTSGDTLYSWGTDGMIRTWDLSRREQVDAFRPEPPC